MAPGCLKRTQGDRITENPEFVTARTESGSSSTGGEERKGEKEALCSGAQVSAIEREEGGVLLAARLRGDPGPRRGPCGGGKEGMLGCGGWFPGAPPLFFFIFFYFSFPKHFSKAFSK